MYCDLMQLLPEEPILEITAYRKLQANFITSLQKLTEDFSSAQTDLRVYIDLYHVLLNTSSDSNEAFYVIAKLKAYWEMLPQEFKSLKDYGIGLTRIQDLEVTLDCAEATTRILSWLDLRPYHIVELIAAIK
ncbi:hypothetical protein SERLA73DRAFT_73203 [Serpula lacrymans var. lacrymans S7.3]|uniref:Uncharacterized protein n=1 Tax=Serpula lacrymans var. lacrymans (strain S7.3) TaxID=936435 RepID=F8PV40_SERL3|nr:hypothetical protein SERLA73DRAFT_73203 [Serpula lacrymans var. lacrymans S7.3]